MPLGRVVIYDDDHYYLGSTIALSARARGCEVTLVTRILRNHRKILFCLFPGIEGEGSKTVTQFRGLPKSLIQVALGRNYTVQWRIP